MFRSLIQLLTPNLKKQLIITSLLSSITALFEALDMLLMYYFLTLITNTSHNLQWFWNTTPIKNRIIITGFSLLLFKGIKFLTDKKSTKNFVHFGENCKIHLTNFFFNKFMDADLLSFKKHDTKEYTNYCVTSSINTSYIFLLYIQLLKSLTAFTCIGIIIAFQSKIMLIAYVLFVAIFVAIKSIASKKKILESGIKSDVTQRRINVILGETFSLFKEIKLYGKEDLFKSKINKELHVLSNARLRFDKSVSTLSLYNEFVIYSSAITIAMLFTFFTNDISQHFSLIGLFFLVLSKSQKPINEMVSFSMHHSNHEGYLQSVNIFLQSLTQPVKNRESSIQIPFFHQLEIASLNFSYPNHPVFINASFECKKNELIGIVGDSGKGKSTLLEILCGLIPASANIKINGSENIGFADLSLLCGYLPQKVTLLYDTIYNNIVLDDSPVTEQTIAKVWQVLEAVEMKFFVERIDNGLEYIVGENGSNLSGGQIQRIGLARVLYRNPQILLLDEFSAALDKETESKIFETLLHLKEKYTIILSTHSTELKNKMDKIYCVEDHQLKLL